MLVKPLAMYGAVKEALALGDIMDTREVLPQTNTSAAATVTLTGLQFVAGELILAGATAQQVLLPTADQLVKAVAGSLNTVAPPGNQLYGTLPQQSVTLQWPANALPLDPGATWRRIVINTNTGTVTLGAQSNSGVTLTGTATAATLKNIEFLIKILNSAPAITLVVSTSNAGGAANKKLTNVDRNLIANISAGMSVYGTGIGASAVVTGVDLDLGIIYVDVDSTATADNIAVSFTPTVIFRRLRLADN